jgi:hypothetical protein
MKDKRHAKRMEEMIKHIKFSSENPEGKRLLERHGQMGG